MTMIRYNPWAFSRDVSRVLHATPVAASTWVPPVDIAEYEDRFVLTADLPGVEPSAIEVTLDNGVLTLAGQRGVSTEASAAPTDGANGDVTPATATAETPAPTRRRSERAIGRFSRRFTLPDTVDVEHVAARNTHGVLEISIPKRPQAQARKIAVVH